MSIVKNIMYCCGFKLMKVLTKYNMKFTSLHSEDILSTYFVKVPVFKK